jgi:hypothetical protein
MFVACFLAVIFVVPHSEANADNAEFDGYALFSKLSKEDAWKKARVMAQSDFAHGVYRVFVYGLRPVKNPYDDYLKEKYGEIVTPIAGCIVSGGILGAADGYNSTMEPLLKQKFGHDIFKEAKKASGR